MIGTIDVKINAAHPNLPLQTVYTFVDSPFAPRIIGVPRHIGNWNITRVFVSVARPDNEVVTIEAKNVAGCFVATIPACGETGTSTGGFQVLADGVDENGTGVTGYCLGRGDFTVLERDGSIMSGGVKYYFHFVDSIPSNPNKGDVTIISGSLQWWNGSAWVLFGGGGGDVKHSDFSRFEELRESCTTEDIREKFNGVLRKLKGAAICIAAALFAASAFGGVKVNSVLLRNIPLTSKVVTNVTYTADEFPTNIVRDLVASATNGFRKVDGSARPLPKYLHALDFADSYPDAAQEYYRSRGDGKVDGGCSAVRAGNFLYRNFDFPFDDRAEFVVRMSAGIQLPTTNYQLPTRRYASIGIAQVGTNLTEDIVTSGKWSPCYKWLPGATVDGINENGVVAEINVVDGDPQTSGWHNDTGDIHPLAAVRWALDNGTSTAMVASNLASRIAFPAGWTQNFHWMIAGKSETYIVENGDYHAARVRPVMTNFRRYPTRDTTGAGQERYDILTGGANITNAWYTRAYHRETNPPWVSDLAEVLAYTNEIFDAWASHPKEYFRTTTNYQLPTTNYTWWQTVHTSIYDITNKTLRVAVQETDDFYTFQVPSAGGEPYVPSATDPVFSNAVLAVQISTNDFAALYELKAAFADLPIDPVTGGISLGSLLAALAAAVAWLKKNKVQTVKLDDGSISKSSDGGVVKLDDFFGESNTLLGETIRAKSAQLALDEDGEIIVTMNTED